MTRPRESRARRKRVVRRLLGLRQHEPRALVVPERYQRVALPDALPSISIVTASLNQGRFIDRTIESVVSQGYPRLEYRIHDGGSRDGTDEVLRRWKGAVDVVTEQDSGQTNALNKAFAATRGEVMAYLNSDDVLLPGSLAYAAAYFAAHPNVDVVYSHRVVIDEDDRVVGRWILPRHDARILAWADFVPQETMFWRRSVWDRVGGSLDESLDFAMDWDLLLRFQRADATIVRVPRFLGAFRVHDEQKTTADIEHGMREMDIIRERHSGPGVTSDDFRKEIRAYVLKRLIYRGLYHAHLLRV